MTKTEQKLLDRLFAIAMAVKESGHGLALLGLGSVGLELERLDRYSDLDFFVIARPGQKSFFLDSLSWLERIQPVVFAFKNTDDGHKLLFADGIFCETAIFEPEELANVPYSAARVLWQDAASSLHFPESNALPQRQAQAADVEWLVGEILSNLLVGLGRFCRGEKLSAARFIQGYAVDRLLELAAHTENPALALADGFDSSRRFEQRFPLMARELSNFMPGYDHSPQAAMAILNFLERDFKINHAVKEAIFAWCGCKEL